MTEGRKKLKFLPLIVIVAALFGVAYLGRTPYKVIATIHELLAENKELKQALTNLDDKLNKILEKEYTIAGDIIHFDALIVKFGNKMVMDGRTRALYLWRRVYGEKMTPADGYTIEEPGAEPQRYKDMLEALPIEQRQMFWSEIWELANDTEKLAEYDIDAIYGNAVYWKLREGLIYVFKINSSGQVYPETVPDL
jgi:hypothetical protein